MKHQPLICVKNLSIAFKKNGITKHILHNISFDVYKNEILGIVGESGSGKSITALSIIRLLKTPHIEGKIVYDDMDLNTIPSKKMERIRGYKISMIFQEPMSALNPSMRCGDQVKEMLLQHNIVAPKNANAEVIRLFESVKIPSPEHAINKYPHELSGGQQQRIMIAMAVACKPDVLIADEPTTALDVTVQNEIIDLIQELQKETQMSVIFISHDLALVSEIAHRTVVMYKGKIVEQGATTSIFKTPKNEYTKALIAARPSLNVRLKKLPTVEDVLSKTMSLEKVSKKIRKEKHKELYRNPPLLEVIDLEKFYYSKVGVFSKQTAFKAISNVSFKLYELSLIHI